MRERREIYFLKRQGGHVGEGGRDGRESGREVKSMQ
jgi:hypothetical protein